jgi:hypothetical protein
MVLGIDLLVSPHFREINYSYTWRDEGEKRVKTKLLNKYPTFHLSFERGSGEEFHLHDPDSGILIPIWRGPGGIRRIINFEHNLPFTGVSLEVSGRIAKHDIWNELSNVIERHWLREPQALLHERTISLVKELQQQGINIASAESIEECRESALFQFPTDSRQYAELSGKLQDLDRYLRALRYSYDVSWLPEPDLAEDASQSGGEQWERYSDDQMRKYLNVLFSTFLTCYGALVKKNLSKVSDRMNLYRQWPVSMVVLISPSRDRVRVLCAPETDEDEAKLRIGIMPVDSQADIADGNIMVDDLSLDQYVRRTLRSTGRATTSTYLIDTQLETEHLFRENALNHLTYNWVKSELAEILQIPFQFGA